jgi:outer membrane protein assembly factor BamB
MPIIRCRVALCTAILLAVSWGNPAFSAPLALREVWTANTHTFTESGASVEDINGDGVAEVIVAGRQELIAYGSGGTEIWRWPVKGRFMTYPAIHIDPKLGAFIYAATFSGDLYCIDGGGKLRWEQKLNAGSSWSSTVVFDLDGDGAFEVIQTDEKGTVWTFDAQSGTPEWQCALIGRPVSPAVADLDGDGKSEVVVTTGEGKISAINSTGGIIWTSSIGSQSESWSTSAPVIFRQSGGASRVLVGSGDGKVYCIDAAGKEDWRVDVRGPVASGISVGDVDQDGAPDIFVATQLGVVYRFREDGARVWEIDMQSRCLAAGAIVDLDGDGWRDYLLASQSGYLVAYDAMGRKRFERQFDTRTINVTPAFGEIEQSTPGLEFVLTGGESGKVFCMSSAVLSADPNGWTAYRGNEQKTASWLPVPKAEGVEMTAKDLESNKLLASSNIEFLIQNTKGYPGALNAQASCVTPLGETIVSQSKIVGEQGILLLNLHALTQGKYRFTWSLDDKDGMRLLTQSAELSIVPFKNDRELAIAAMDKARQAAQRITASAPILARALGAEVESYSKAIDRSLQAQSAFLTGNADLEESVIEELEENERRATWLAHFATVAEQAATGGDKGSIVLFEMPLWDSRDVESRLPDKFDNGLTISRRLVSGEHAPLSIGALNLTKDSIEARIQIDQTKGGPTIVAQRSVPVITSTGETSWDPLPELDDTQSITIPPMATAELWLDATSADAAPGKSTATVRVQWLPTSGKSTSEGPRQMAPLERTVALEFEVLPFQMAAPGEFRLCAWASHSTGAIEDMLAHGNNVFIVHHGKVAFDATGNMAKIDYEALDHLLKSVAGHDVFLLLNGVPNLGVPFEGENYAPRLKRYIDDLTNHLAEHKIDTDHFAMYPVDEPGGNGVAAVDQTVRFAKMIREINPAIMNYIDGGGEMPMYDAMKDCIDVWTPGIDMLPHDTPEMRIQRTNGKHLWTYDCAYAFSRPLGPNIKNTNIVAQFYNAPLFAMRHGATGIGYWSYNIGDNPWARQQFEYPLVYPGKSMPVTSRRWEAVREGIEDHRILGALKKLAKSQSTDPALAKRIDALSGEKLSAMIDRGYRSVPLGQARYVIDFDNNETILNAFRKELLDCVEAHVSMSTQTPPQ